MIYKRIIFVTLIGSTLACTAETTHSENKNTISSKEEVIEKNQKTDLIVEEIDTQTIAIENTIKLNKPKQVSLPKEEIKETIVEIEEVKAIESKPAPVKVVAYSPSHSAFDALLKKYVTASGNVNYSGFKSEKAKLDVYLGLLAKNAPSSSWKREEKLAYWINLYNAGTIQLILKNYPIKSIMDINGGKAWDIKFVKSGTKTLSLNQIENEIIRPTFKEPRIHFAVNCAAVSCPKLLNGAFMPHTLEKQLETATKKFINNKSKNSITASSIKISKIFEWYAVDFGGKSNLVKYFNKYSTIKINSSASVSFKEYKWELNK